MSPPELPGITRRFELADLTLYATIAHDGGKPAVLLLHGAKFGSLERGLLEVLADMTSKRLQAGVPLAEILETWRGTTFEPGGFIHLRGRGTPCSSVLDALARWLTEAER